MANVIHQAAYEAGIKRNIIDNARKTFCSTYSDHESIISFLDSGRTYDDYGCISYKETFIGKMANSFDNYGKLTEKQVEAVRKIITQRAERRAQWADQQAELNANRQHVGVIGKRMSLSLTVKKVIEISKPKFSYYDSDWTYIVILEDAAQNVFIYKGTSLVSPSDEGQTFEVTFTPKEHGVRDGVKQPIISRPKIK